MSLVPTFAVVLSGIVACATDLRSRRIPNWLTFGSAAIAFVSLAALDGEAGIQRAAGGWVVGTLLFLPLFLLGGMGGGDVKLLAAFGAWLGPREVLWLGAYASMAGGVLAIGVAVRQAYLGAMFRNVASLLRTWWLTGLRPVPALTLERGKGPRLAYAIPMFIGAMVTLWRH